MRFSGRSMLPPQKIKRAGPSFLRASGTPFLRQGKPALRKATTGGRKTQDAGLKPGATRTPPVGLKADVTKGQFIERTTGTGDSSGHFGGHASEGRHGGDGGDRLGVGARLVRIADAWGLPHSGVR